MIVSKNFVDLKIEVKYFTMPFNCCTYFPVKKPNFKTILRKQVWIDHETHLIQ